MSSTQLELTGFGPPGATQVPVPLQSAIETAAQQYHVPTDILAGIWREESGSTYPNTAVNSAGYGGLFGTPGQYAADAPVVQADEAASILAAGLRQSGGNIAEALSYYNSGKLQGGYTSVPGETTFGTIAVPSPSQAQLLNPSTGQSVGTTQPATGEGGALTSGVGSAVSGVTSAAGAVGSELGSIGSSLSSTLSFVFSYRFLEIIGGTILIALGVVLVGRQLVGGGPASVASKL